MVSLGHLPYFIDIDIAFDYFRDSRANGISADGTTIVGYSAIVPESLNLGLQLRTKAFRYTDEEGLVDLGYVPAYGLIETKAVDVSADGSVIVEINGSSFC